jgi:hypothetical protein
VRKAAVVMSRRDEAADGPRPADQPCGDLRRPHRAVARWDGEVWQVRVQDAKGLLVAETTARRIETVPSAARAALPERSCTDRGGSYVDLRVDVTVPPKADALFGILSDRVRTACREVDQLVAMLSDECGMSRQDIVTLLRRRHLQVEPTRPLLVSNAEIAVDGLSRHPDVIAVVWEDRGFAITTFCRACAETDRSPWADLPHGGSALVYDPPAHCDNCGRDLDESANE